MIGVQLNQRARRVLEVVVDEGLAVDVSTTPSDYFPVGIVQSSNGNATLETGPRSGRSPLTLWFAQSALTLHGGDRLQPFEGDIYELLAHPKPALNGRQAVGYLASVLPVDELYPRSATLHEQGSDTSIVTVPCSVFGPTEFTLAHGEYLNVTGEAPASLWAHLQGRNRELRFAGGERFKVSEATLSRELPYVQMALRRVT